jgi:hypothetical protein
MENKEEKFPEQEAPQKNTDHAFVQVGTDGRPVIPHTADEKKEDKKDNISSAGNKKHG